MNIDIERGDFEAALLNQEFGHTYVRFWESNGREYTFGFYPAKDLPNENRKDVPGCVHHPDTTHDTCIDGTVAYGLTEQQYTAALARAQQACREPHHWYGLQKSGSEWISYTCTTYAEDVVRAAGMTLPSSKSTPTTIYYQPVPGIDNPNTLLENVRAAREKANLTSDSGIRAWVNGTDLATIGLRASGEMIRMINRLLDGYVSDDDVAAIEKICQSVGSAAQMKRIRDAIQGRLGSLNNVQGSRVRNALNRDPGSP